MRWAAAGSSLGCVLDDPMAAILEVLLVEQWPEQMADLKELMTLRQEAYEEGVREGRSRYWAE